MCSAALFPISMPRCFSEDWRIQYFWLEQFPGAQLSLGVNLILRLLASFLLYHSCYVCRIGLTSGPWRWNVPPPRVVFPSHPPTHAHSGTSWVHTPRPVSWGISPAVHQSDDCRISSEQLPASSQYPSPNSLHCGIFDLHELFVLNIYRGILMMSLCFCRMLM